MIYRAKIENYFHFTNNTQRSLQLKIRKGGRNRKTLRVPTEAPPALAGRAGQVCKRGIAASNATDSGKPILRLDSGQNGM